jgi:rod shape-determining protein MreC
VHGKTVRRRRAVLLLLVVLSLLLLTAYFEEPQGGALHSVQRGFLTVVSPIQDGANKALEPLRNLVGWFGSTLKAKSELEKTQKQLDQLRAKLISREADDHGYHELAALLHIDQLPGVAGYRRVTASVLYKSPNIWYSTVTIDEGTAAGVQAEDPVINAEGLVGKVTLAASDAAVVSLITDSTMGVAARVNGQGAVGIVQPKVGDPGDLLLEYLPADANVASGQYVVTSGTILPPYDSLFPPGIAIGQVTSVNEEAPYKVVNVSPIANLHNLDTVQVLTDTPGSRAARLSRFSASLPGATGEGSSPSSPTKLAQTGGGG